MQKAARIVRDTYNQLASVYDTWAEPNGTRLNWMVDAAIAGASRGHAFEK